MRLVALFAALALLNGCDASSAAPLPLTVRTIESFGLGGSNLAEGSLEFLGGLQVTSSDANFGGLSGIDMLDADTAFMVSDAGTFVRARLVRENGRLVGLADGEIGSLFPDGGMEKRVSDAEDVAIDPADPRRGVIVRERQANAMLTFDLEDGRPVNFTPKAVGAPDRLLRSNRGLESVAYAPTSSPYAGAIVAIAEHPPAGETDIPGWIAGVGKFTIVRRDNFDVSSARFLPNGDLVLLERRYSIGWGLRLRRIAGAAIKPAARLDGEILLDAGVTSQIDNMEGLAIGPDARGRIVLTLVSDDNYSVLQRTLILQFGFAED